MNLIKFCNKFTDKKEQTSKYKRLLKIFVVAGVINLGNISQYKAIFRQY